MPGDGTQERRKTSDLMRKSERSCQNFQRVYHTHAERTRAVSLTLRLERDVKGRAALDNP